MKKYALFIVLFCIMVFGISCGGNAVRSSGQYNYSYNESDFNKYHWGPWERAQWVQNHNGWILNVKKCTYHNRWNGQTFAMWFYDKKCEFIYTAYQITPEMCHGENPKKFLWERGFRSIMYYTPSNIDVELLTPNLGGFTRYDQAYISSGTIMGPTRMNYNNGSSIASAPEPLSAEEIRAKYLEETQRALALNAIDKKKALLSKKIAELNERTRLFMSYLELTNQTLTKEEEEYHKWLLKSFEETLRAEVVDNTLWYQYPDGTVEHLMPLGHLTTLRALFYERKAVPPTTYYRFQMDYFINKTKAEMEEKKKEEEKMKKRAQQN